MKGVSTFLLLLLCKNLHCQSNIIKAGGLDTLNSYCYSWIGFNQNRNLIKPAGGTCFFIRKNNRIFLVTAKHVASGCDDSVKVKDYPNILNVYIRDSSGFPIKYIDVNIIYFVNNIPCISVANNPDIIAFEIKSNLVNELKSVESFIRPPFKNTDGVEINGFPEYKYHDGAGMFNMVSKPTNISINKMNTYIYTNGFTGGKYDSSAYWIENKGLIVGESLHGFSGSPVFLKELNTNKIRILGCFSASSFDSDKIEKKYYIIPKIQYAIDQINAYLSKNQ